MVGSIEGPVSAVLMLMVRFVAGSALAPSAGASDSIAAASDPASAMVQARFAGLGDFDGMEEMAFLH
jgi:hypothetical protein